MGCAPYNSQVQDIKAVLSQLIQTNKIALIYMKFTDELMKWSLSDFYIYIHTHMYIHIYICITAFQEGERNPGNFSPVLCTLK